MKRVKTKTIRHEGFARGLDAVISDHRLPVATKEKLYDNMIKMEDAVKLNMEEVHLVAINKEEIFPFVSVAVLLSLRPIID